MPPISSIIGSVINILETSAKVLAPPENFIICSNVYLSPKIRNPSLTIEPLI